LYLNEEPAMIRSKWND